MKQNLDIHLLRSFLEVASNASFTAASKNLCLTQSAVSAQIRRLEKQLGVKLLCRDNRNVRLTEAGELLLNHAKRILAINDEAFCDLDVVGRVQGTVRLGIPSDYAAHLLPVVLERYGSQYPDVQLELFCELSVDLLGLLHKGRIDLALLTRQRNSQGGELIRSEQLVWAGAKNKEAHLLHPLPLALFPPGFCIFRENALAALHKAERPYRLVCTSRSLSGIRAAVSAGLAVTVVAEHTLSSEMQVFGTAEGLPPLPKIEIALHTASAVMSPAASTLARFFQETLGRNVNDCSTSQSLFAEGNATPGAYTNYNNQ